MSQAAEAVPVTPHGGVLCRICEQAVAPIGSNYCPPCRRRDVVMTPLAFVSTGLGIALGDLTTAINAGNRAGVERNLTALRGLRDQVENLAEVQAGIAILATCGACKRRYTESDYQDLAPRGVCRCGSQV